MSIVRDLVAQSRIEIDQARLYVYRTAWLIDHFGAKGARSEIAGIKIAATAMATRVIDRAIEVFGAAGVSDDTPLASFYAWARALRIVDGPDAAPAVHRPGRVRAQARLRRLKTPSSWRSSGVPMLGYPHRHPVRVPAG